MSAMTTLMAIPPIKSPMFPINKNTGIKPSIVVKVDANRGENKCLTLFSKASSRVKDGSNKLIRISSVITMALSHEK